MDEWTDGWVDEWMDGWIGIYVIYVKNIAFLVGGFNPSEKY